MSTPLGSEPIRVTTERMATGGEAVARLPDGRVVFVAGALDGEVVDIRVTQSKKRYARGITHQIVEPSPLRREPECRHSRSGECGGCDWMFIQPARQLTAKAQIVREQLERLGGVASPTVETSPMTPGHRTTVRCSVVDGSAGYRARRSDSAFSADECPAAHPLLQELIADGDFGDADQVTLRAGATSGERLVVTDGDPRSVHVPNDVLVVSADDPGDAAFHETVAGIRWHVSARSFFQASPEGAEALVAAVSQALDDVSGPVVDLYAGVGLLGGAVAAERLACAVEWSESSVADARRNLHSLSAVGADTDIVRERVERWEPLPCDGVIADPARRGLAAEAVDVVNRTGASRLALVSCDPASLGRDTSLLIDAGWRHDRSAVIDMFPDTSRIEVVSTFTR